MNLRLLPIGLLLTLCNTSLVYARDSLAVASHSAQSTKTQSQHNIDSLAITAPDMDGAKVACERTIEGTAVLPSGAHLWILAHRTDGFEDVWWPQNEARVDPVTRIWKVNVTFGGIQDIGKEFEIAATIVDETQHMQLRNHRKDALKTGKWLPIDMPIVLRPPVIRRVMKASHDGCS